MLVNRSGMKAIGDKAVFALIDRHLPAWDASACPLCAGGSIAIRPKDNWAELTARRKERSS
jgi:hypothetical protein